MATLKMILAATALAAAAATATAATHQASYHKASYHRASASHAKYVEECSALAGQWSSAVADHKGGRKLHSARRQESIAARDCNSKHTASLKDGVQHYRSALRMIGVKPQA